MPSEESQNRYSEDVEEIMGKIPNWMIRWGLTLIFLIFVMIITGSYFFRYPEVVSAPLMITSYNTPAILNAKAGGKIEKILAENEALVKPDEVVAIIKNQAEYKDVQAIEKTIKTFSRTNIDEFIRSNQFPAQLRLGEIQNTYTIFKKTAREFRYYINSNYLPLKIKFLKEQIETQNEILKKQKEQLVFQKEDLALTLESFHRDSTLYKMGTYAISKAEYDRSKQELLQKQASVVGFESTLKNTVSGILKQQETLIDLKQQHKEEMNRFHLSLDENLQNLKTAIEQWKDHYLIISPISGKITFTSFWNENQVLTSGEKFATVVPVKETKIIAKAVIPHSGFGKVEEGQNVNIKLSGFPYMEYGILKGRISALSLVPEDGGYIAEIELIKGMTSSYREQLKFIQEMDGTADIITKNTRAIYRFMQPLKAFFDDQF
jgi:multidrug efflux pump subunit AcrA (membrane-fusion protein)